MISKMESGWMKAVSDRSRSKRAADHRYTQHTIKPDDSNQRKREHNRYLASRSDTNNDDKLGQPDSIKRQRMSLAHLQKNQNDNQKTNIEDKNILKFLLFNFILANDTHEVQAILNNKGGKSLTENDMMLTGKDIKQYIHDCPVRSMQCLEKYRALFQSCLDDMCNHRLRLARHVIFQLVNRRDLIGKYCRLPEVLKRQYILDQQKLRNKAQKLDNSSCCAKMYVTLSAKSKLTKFAFRNQHKRWKNLSGNTLCSFDCIPLLELASTLCATYKSTKMLELILSLSNFRGYYDLTPIICNPSVSNDAVSVLLQYKYKSLKEVMRENGEEYSHVDHIYEVLHGHATASIAAYFDACQKDTEDPFEHRDTSTTLSKIERFFNGCTGKAIEIRNSRLFRLARKQYANTFEDLESLVRCAIDHKAWYILHLILTDKDIELQGRLSWDNAYMLSERLPLFIVNYLLKTFFNFHHKALEKGNRNPIEIMKLPQTYEKLCVARYFQKDNQLLQWLVCAYMTRIESNIRWQFNLSDLINSQCIFPRVAPTMPWIFCKLLTPLGIDIQTWTWPNKSNMCFAIARRDMRFVRVLLYHSYDFTNDNAASLAYADGSFRILKVLVLCGDRFSKDDGDFSNETQYEYSEQDAMAGLWLKEWLSQPPSLSFYCRKSIRQNYKTALPRLLNAIAYPNKLKKFLRTEILV